jgi:Plasmid pRiA4b ORF-3-like protein
MPELPNPVIYQLKIAFRGIRPLLWRRLLVHAETSRADPHDILQLAMGWTGSPLHRFLIHGQAYGIAYDGGLGFADDPKQIWVAEFRFRLRERFLYESDFRDNWRHDLRGEHIVAADPKRSSPVCSGGKRAAPPEACGGAEVYVGRWRHWKSDFLCHRLQADAGETERDFFTADEDEASHELGSDPDHLDRRQLNAQWRRWGARGGCS